MTGTRLKSIVQSLGFLFFVVLAGYGLLAIIAGGPLAGAAPGAAPAQQTDSVIPLLINYQGYLLDGDGNTLDGTHQITFRIYDSPAPGAAPLHEETHAAIQVRNGYFSVLLGDQADKPLPANVFSDANRYIGIQVAPHEEMIPRQRLASVAYAFSAAQAANADLLDGHDTDFFMPATGTHFLNAKDGTPGQAVYVDEAGQVGIGTTAPGQELTVKAIGSHADVRLTNPVGTSWDLAVRGDDASLRFAAVGVGDALTILRNRRVGIGTTSPDHTLDVNGDLRFRGTLVGIETMPRGSGSDYYWTYVPTSTGSLKHTVAMTPVSTSFCALTKVGLEDLDTGGEFGHCIITANSRGNWELTAEVGTSGGRDAIASCQARCIDWNAGN